jgi:putative mycofactocin binding protein MftB
MIKESLMMEEKYKLAPGTQVREEDFVLLFYTMAGPRLYFLASGNLLNENFFDGQLTLTQWINRREVNDGSDISISVLKAGIEQLKKKGVILGC